MLEQCCLIYTFLQFLVCAFVTFRFRIHLLNGSQTAQKKWWFFQTIRLPFGALQFFRGLCQAVYWFITTFLSPAVCGSLISVISFGRYLRERWMNSEKKTARPKFAKALNTFVFLFVWYITSLTSYDAGINITFWNSSCIPWMYQTHKTASLLETNQTLNLGIVVKYVLTLYARSSHKRKLYNYPCKR